MTSAQTWSRRLVASALVAALVGVSAACSGSDGASSDAGSTAAAAPEEASGVPEECAKPFPQAFSEPDLAEVTLSPDGFPEPPFEATLCLTTSTVDNSQETASYATGASADEVLAGYESALSAYSPSRDTDGVGRPIVVAQDGDLTIQVTPKAGGFVIAFANA
jgi:hypothetical protein